jgi:hypothetical protein
MTLAIGALPFAPNILIDPLISSLFYLSFYSMSTTLGKNKTLLFFLFLSVIAFWQMWSPLLTKRPKKNL